MRKLALLVIAAGLAGLAGPALAGPGQCYDAYGRPVGPVYDTNNPNYRFIDAIVRSGGTCTGVVPGWERERGHRHYDYSYAPKPRYYGYKAKRYWRDDHGGYHYRHDRNRPFKDPPVNSSPWRDSY